MRGLVARFEETRDLRIMGGYKPGADAELDRAAVLVPKIYQALEQDLAVRRARMRSASSRICCSRDNALKPPRLRRGTSPPGNRAGHAARAAWRGKRRFGPAASLQKPCSMRE